MITQHDIISSINAGKITHDFTNETIPYLDLTNESLTSLKGVPSLVEHDFIVSYNKLTTLQGGPKYTNNYLAVHNKLTSLIGCADRIGNHLIVSNNNIQSLEGYPSDGSMINLFIISDNPLSSLHNVHKHISSIAPNGQIKAQNVPIYECILGLILITNLSKIKFSIGDDSDIVENIINKYLGGGKTVLYRCAQELVNAGYPDLAKL